MNTTWILFTILLGLSSMGQAATLSVSTFNAGFLDNEVYEVPDYSQRLSFLSAELGDKLSGDSSDLKIMFLQEIWHKDAFKLLRKNLKSNFLSASESYEKQTALELQHETGLDVLIPQELSNKIKVSFKPFVGESGQSLTAEVDSQLNAKRGALMVELSWKNKKILLVNTQMTSLIDNTALRAQQVTSLIKIISNYKYDLLILGGDFNFSPFFQFQPKEEMEGSKELWTENGQNYFQLKNELRAVDTINKSYKEQDFMTQNRSLNDITKASPGTSQEPDQRTDQIWYRSSKALACGVVKSELIFNQPILSEGKPVMSRADGQRKLFLSDHFGVNSVLNCQL